jgi:hypothetical protein
MNPNKRNQKESTLSEVLGQFIEVNRLQAGMNQVNIKDAWFEVMGNGVKSYTKDVVLRGSKLYVSLTSSVLREELSHGRQKIIEMLNEHMRADVVKQLNFY